MATTQMFETSEHELIFELIYDADNSIMPAKDLSEAIAGIASAMSITGRVTKLDFESIYVFPPENGSIRLRLGFSRRDQRVIYLATVSGALGNIISSTFLGALTLFNQHTITAFKNPNGDMLSNISSEVATLCTSNDFRKSVTKFAKPVSEINQKLTVKVEGESFEIDCNNQYKFIQEESELILPDLHDGQQYTLHGKVTRMNLETNEIGFLYMNKKVKLVPADKEKKVGQEFSEFLKTPDVLVTGIIERKSYTEPPKIKVVGIQEYVPPSQATIFYDDTTDSALTNQ